MKYVIIGAGAAGVNAAEILRKRDNKGEIVVIGEEKFFPYNRYRLTDFFCDAIGQDDLFYTSTEFFREIGATFRKGQSVKAIKPEEKCIKLSHNEVVNYDKLLIATGGVPSLGPVLKPYAGHIQRYYSLQDICVLKKKLPQIRSCIVFGQGLSSLDLMCGLHKLKKEVTYIIRGSKPQWPILDAGLIDEMFEFLKEKGIKIISDDRVTAIEAVEQGCRVLTLKQRELTADVVFAWDNYVPNISLVSGTGIEKKSGILVNEYLETSVTDIYAAGDCAEIYHPGRKTYWVNFGWPNALEQGEVAAVNMTGQKKPYQVHEILDFSLMGKQLKARWWE